MLLGLTLLLGAQLLGEFVSRWLGLPIPGPVVGLALLFVALAVYGDVPAPLRTAAEGLLRYLALLFVPAGVGLMVHFTRIGEDAIAILVALLGSTIVAIVVTALGFRWTGGVKRNARLSPKGDAEAVHDD